MRITKAFYTFHFAARGKTATQIKIGEAIAFRDSAEVTILYCALLTWACFLGVGDSTLLVRDTDENLA